jgi:glycosyltransferase involved in cell wall biosynthesis
VKRVLIIAYYFPPIGGIGSIRLGRFAELLPDFGWEPTVIAPRRTPHTSDPSLTWPEEKVIRSLSIEPAILGRSTQRRAGPGQEAARGAAAGRSFVRSIRGSLRRAAHRYVYYPDPQVGWYPGALRAGLGALRRHSFDAVFSSSVPVTGHLVARSLARRAGLPWVAEFRDPWSDRLPPDHPYRRRAASLEAAIAGEAKELIFPSPTWSAHYADLWSRAIEVIPNGHDSPNEPGVAVEEPILTYAGSYHPGMQSLEGVWAAIRDLARERPSEAPRVRVIGEIPDRLRAEVEGFGLGDRVEMTGFLPHDDAVREMARSSILLACGPIGDDVVSRGWIPAKLFEYLATGRPILYLGDREGDAAELLGAQPGCHLVDPGDVAGVTEVLRSSVKAGPIKRDLEGFSRRSRTEALAQVLGRAAEVSP